MISITIVILLFYAEHVLIENSSYKNTLYHGSLSGNETFSAEISVTVANNFLRISRAFFREPNRRMTATDRGVTVQRGMGAADWRIQ
jgi:hypothetical protein